VPKSIPMLLPILFLLLRYAYLSCQHYKI
jgi:hypothetical protein